MEKECCNCKVTETEDGFKVEVKGEGLKEMVKSAFKNCCGENDDKKGFQFCCGSGK